MLENSLPIRESELGRSRLIGTVLANVNLHCTTDAPVLLTASALCIVISL
jgi:hypothetical protein